MNLIVDSIIFLYQKYGGISQLYLEILPRLCNLEPELTITLLTYSQVLPENLPKHKRIILRPLPDFYRYFRPHRFLLPYYSQLDQLTARIFLGRGKGDTWLSTYYTSPIAWAGPQVVFTYDFIYEKYRALYKHNELPEVDRTIRNKAAAIAKADLVICISETTRQDLLDLYHFPIEKTAVVKLANKSSFFLMEGIPVTKKKKFILYVGNRNNYKDFKTLLRSYAIWPGHIEFDLVCAGGGEWTETEQQDIVHYKVDNRVFLFPKIDDQHLCRLYNQASAFIYPSQYEGFGIPLLEAMACGCPIVASRIPSTLEVAGDIPFYFEPRDSSGLIIALDKAIDSGKMCAKVQEGLAHVSQYSWDNTSRGILNILKKVSKSS
jgi:glycosyltransferase involved in cell wall biosynthesis